MAAKHSQATHGAHWLVETGQMVPQHFSETPDTPNAFVELVTTESSHFETHTNNKINFPICHPFFVDTRYTFSELYTSFLC